MSVSKMFVFGAMFAAAAVLGCAGLVLAQGASAAKANGEAGYGFKNTQPHYNQGGNWGSYQNSDSRRSYSYEPSEGDSDVAAKGPGCAPKMSYKAGDDSKAQAKNQPKNQKKSGAQSKQESNAQASKKSRRSYSQEPTDKSDKSAQSSKSTKPQVAARGKGCAPKLNYKSAQSQKDSRRTYSQEPSQSSKNKWNKSEKEAWQYQKDDPRRHDQ